MGQKNKKGYVLLMSVLIIGSIGTVISISLLILGLGSSNNSLTIDRSNQAKSLANLCGEAALQKIWDSGFTGSGSISEGGGECSYLVSSGGGEARTIESTGNFENVTRKIRIETDQIDPFVNLISWLEVADF